MAYVKFKRGLESSLQPYLSNYTGSSPQEAEDGCIYLAQSGDSVNPTATSLGFRLYVGKTIGNSTKAYPLTQGALILSDISQLPNASDAIPGQFYYVSNTNILAISSGGRWVQINPQTTNTDNFIVDRQASISTTGNVTTVTDILFNSNNQDHLSNDYTFTGSEGFSVNVEPIYGPAGDTYFASDYYTYSSATGTYTKDTTVSASNYSSRKNSLYVVRGYGLVLTPTVYSLTKSVTNGTATITLTDNTTTPANGHTSSINLTGGNGVTIAENVGGAIQISANAPTLQNITIGHGNGYVDSSGNPATLTSDGINIAISDSASNTIKASWNPIIKLQNDNTLHYFEQDGSGRSVITLPVYTIDQVEAIKRGLNAMTYKGVITSSLPSSSVSNGDVYMAGGSISNQALGVNASTGDLLIAQGTEDSSGYIPSADITWAVVSSGTAFDTAPTIGFTPTHGFELGQTVAGGGNPDVLGTFQIAVNSSTVNDSNSNQALNNNFLLATDEGPNNDSTRTVRIQHKTLHTISNNEVSGTTVDSNSDTQSNGVTGVASTLTIPVPQIVYDTAGHIVGIVKHNYQVKDSHATITSSLSVSGSVGVQANEEIATNGATTATVTNTLNIDDSTEILTTNLNLASDSLILRAKETSNSHMISMNIEWGSF